MATSETVDDVEFTQEEKGVRAKAGRLNFLFVTGDLPTIVSAYTALAKQARDHFGPRVRSLSGVRLDEEWFNELLRKMALDRIYRDVIGRQPIDLGARNWDNDLQIRRIIQWAADHKWRRDPAKLALVAAHIMGLSSEEYARWWEGEKRFQDR